MEKRSKKLLSLGVVVGLQAEGRIARYIGKVATGGGTAPGALAAAKSLVAGGARALISFGLAGALDPALRPGAPVIPRRVLTGGRYFATDVRLLAEPSVDLLFGGDRILTSAADKRIAWQQTGASAVDLESGAVALVAAEHGLPFAVLRAICDPAERDLPPAALIALDRQGSIGMLRIFASVLGKPQQILPLLALARDARAASRTLVLLAQQPARQIG